MTIRRVLSVLAVGGALVLVAWVCVLAQTPRNLASASPQPVPQPGIRFPPPPVATAATPYSPSNPYAVQSAFGPQGLTTPVPATPVSSLPAKVELTSGLALAGQV